MSSRKEDDVRRWSTGDLVLPGDRIGPAGEARAGNGLLLSDGELIAAQLGLLIRSKRSVHVIPMVGEYRPGKGDHLIAIVRDHTPSRWFLDANTSHQGRLHSSDTPWNVDFGRTGEYLSIGDVAYVKVMEVDGIGRMDLTMKGPGFRKLTSGEVMGIRPSQVPRLIGRNGALIGKVKEATGCRALIGKNGWIWVDGEEDGLDTFRRVLDVIDESPHDGGVQERILELLEAKEGCPSD